MRILFLAPHPFFQDRGTPIAVSLLLKVLSERGDSIDLLTYHEGENIAYKNVRTHRIHRLPLIKNIGPGFSLKKMVCDVFLFISAMSLLRKNQYDMVHAVEESAFMALIFKMVYKTPYVYDMDSIMSDQVLQRLPFLKAFSGLMQFIEGLAVRHAAAVVAVCDALADFARRFDPQKNIVILRDISLLNDEKKATKKREKISLGIDGLVLMYVGNLEYYQGIDLLLESFRIAATKRENIHLVIIGGSKSDIEKYQAMVEKYDSVSRVHFLGIKSMTYLADYLAQADILASPRIVGNNTPMKIYSYLHSGKAVLATNIDSHTQVLDEDVAKLAAPQVNEFSEALLKLIDSPALRKRLGTQGKKLIEEKHSYTVFKDIVLTLYENLENEIFYGD